MSMFGWIENAVGINQIFTETVPGDIMFRSAFNNNKIIIGNNSNTSAALYISNNNVGIKKVCDTNYALDVNGAANLPILNTDTTTINTLLTAPCIQNDILIAKDIKTTVIFIDATITKVELNSSTGASLTLVFDNPSDSFKLKKGQVIKIANILYNIIERKSNYVIVVDFYNGIPIIPFPLVEQSYINIHVLEDLYKEKIETFSSASVLFNLTEYSMVAANRMMLVISLIDQTHLEHIKLNSLYTFEGSGFLDNVFRLVVVQAVGTSQTNFITHFEYIDQSDINPSTLPLSFPNFNNTVKLTLIESDMPSQLVNDKAIISIDRSTDLNQAPIPDKYYILLNATNENDSFNLSNIINDDTLTQYNPFQYIVLSYLNNPIMNYDILSIVKNQNDVIINYDLDISTQLDIVDTNAHLQTVDVSYSLYGIPLGVNISQENNTYVINDILNMLKRIKVNDKLLILNNYTICTLVGIDLVNSTIILDSNALHEFNTMTVYILPYRTTKTYDLNHNNIRVPGKLCIGTERIGAETLTVGGNISLHNSIVFNNAEKTKTFTQSFEDDVFTIGSNFAISESNIIISNDVFVRGNSYSENFINYSDRRIKNNIVHTNIDQDLEILNNLHVYEFTNKYTKQYIKGFIAQEVEEILPYAVHNEIGVLKSICRNAIVSDQGFIIIENVTPDELSDISVGTPLQIQKLNDTFIMSPIVYLNKHNDTLYLKLSEHIEPNSVIMVIGPYTNVKSVNYNTLLMSCFNCLKVALKDIEQLKQDMKK